MSTLSTLNWTGPNLRITDRNQSQVKEKHEYITRSWLFQLSQFLRIHQRIAWEHLLDELSCSVLSLPLNQNTTPVITPPTTETNTTVIPTEILIIAPTIPPYPDYTPASPDYSPASDTEFDPSEDLSSDHIPSLPAISPFLSYHGQ
ncbi:hypothetical protein Tco_0030947 [Tanacetum coccineum]